MARKIMMSHVLRILMCGCGGAILPMNDGTGRMKCNGSCGQIYG